MNIEFTFTRHKDASTIRIETRNSWKQTSVTMYFQPDNKHHRENMNNPVRKKEKETEDYTSQGEHFCAAFVTYCQA